MGKDALLLENLRRVRVPYQDDYSGYIRYVEFLRGTVYSFASLYGRFLRNSQG